MRSAPGVFRVFALILAAPNFQSRPACISQLPKYGLLGSIAVMPAREGVESDVAFPESYPRNLFVRSLLRKSYTTLHGHTHTELSQATCAPQPPARVRPSYPGPEQIAGIPARRTCRLSTP